MKRALVTRQSSTSSPGWQFLVWALPAAGLRLARYRRVRRQVLRRAKARIRSLGLRDFDEYRRYLEQKPEEWKEVRYLARVTVSRFFRDRYVFDALAARVLPEMVESGAISEKRPLRVWSAGCASGEEAYTLAILAKDALGPPVPVEVLGTDVDPGLCERARTGIYRRSSLREIPRERWEGLFEVTGETLTLRPSCRAGVRFENRDIFGTLPSGLFQIILCRNLLFTYFNATEQRRGLDLLLSRLEPGGALVVGHGERLPDDTEDLPPWPEARLIYRHHRPSS